MKRPTFFQLAIFSAGAIAALFIMLSQPIVLESAPSDPINQEQSTPNAPEESEDVYFSAQSDVIPSSIVQMVATAFGFSTTLIASQQKLAPPTRVRISTYIILLFQTAIVAQAP